jgi:hypothetical protein
LATTPIPSLPDVPPGQPRPWAGNSVLLLALAAPVAALAATPWFVTQDGPAHLYNAEVLAQSLTGGSPFRPWYEVRWEPLPNWAGHLVLAGLGAILPPRWSNLAINTLTLAGFAAAIHWLRWTVAGARGLGVGALFATLLSMNIAWLFGFTSFLLGACVFAVTLGVWWRGRDQLGARRIAALAILVVLGYFSHLVSLVVTVTGLGILALLTPSPCPCRERPVANRQTWAARLFRTALAVLPLVPLGALYLNLSRRGGEMRPVWGHLSDPLAPGAWLAQLSWADPISIASKNMLPFAAAPTRVAGLLAPIAWLLLALGLAVAVTWKAATPTMHARRGWTVLALVLIAGGAAAPDTLGQSHGHYLPQRIVLLGLAALLPTLELDPRHWPIRAAAAALVVALSVQSALVWDYAQEAQRVAGAFWRARETVGNGQRVAALPVQLQPPRHTRANPLLHADCLLGLGTGNVIWGNYETRHYYFPIRFRAGFDRPDAGALEAIALRDDPRDATARAEDWEQLLARHHDAIDALVVWGREPRLDAINARWFYPSAREGMLQVLRHR